MESFPIDADGGTSCSLEPARVEAVVCPPSTVSYGADVVVSISHGVDRCCATATPTVESSSSGLEHTVTASWEVCSCDASGCAGPSQTDEVSLGRLEIGEHHIHTEAGDCTVVVERSSECTQLPADEVYAPRVLYPDQPMAATMHWVDDGWCECTPELVESARGSGFQLCGCLDPSAPCNGSAYAVGWVGAPLPVGEHTLTFGSPTQVQVTVIEAERCAPRTATALRIVGPNAGMRAPDGVTWVFGGRRVWWAIVGGNEQLCCVEPMPAVSHAMISGNTFELSLASCVESDCACVGSLVPFEAWHALGELAPGDYTARIDGVTRTFTVP